MPKLGVNIDHVATVRQARQTDEPDPIAAAKAAEAAGCDSIVCHLREDRRHIQDADLQTLKKVVTTRLNVEMAASSEIVSIVSALKPEQATLVPEKREEVTTEGGLDVVGNQGTLKPAVEKLLGSGIDVSLFVDPEPKQLEASKALGVSMVELHTGAYANAETEQAREAQIKQLVEAIALGQKLGLMVHVGHGLTYRNVQPVADLKGLTELNIGHSIIARSVFVGVKQAVQEMIELTRNPS